MLSPDPIAVKAQLERILSSKLFRRSQVISNFLKYVVTLTIEEKTGEIKEYTIGVKALGKPADFNPQIDAVIRIHAGRLRRSLMEYYQEEGQNDTVQISMSRGSYVPAFCYRESMNSAEKMISTLSVNSKRMHRVAVIPFKNLTGKPENEFLVDGFCEQLSSDLAQFPEIAVIAYFSTSKFRGERSDIRDVGKELSASHLITGSIYRDQSHLRISMQLVNAHTGEQTWTQTYERAVESSYLYDIFDDIIKQVVPKLSGYYGLISRNSSFSTSLGPTLNPDTIDAVFWYYHYQIKYTEETFQIARKRIEKELRQNPDYALGWGLLAQMYIDGEALCYVTVPDPLQKAGHCVQNALQLDPDCQHAYISLAWMYVFTHEKEKSAEAIKHCVGINPRSSFFLAGSCFLSGIIGEYEQSLEYFRQAQVLNPYYPWWVNLGPFFTHFYHEDYEQALEFANRINIPGVFWHYVIKIAALGQLQRLEEAAELKNILDDNFSGKAEKACQILKHILIHESVCDRVREGLLKSGVESLSERA